MIRTLKLLGAHIRYLIDRAFAREFMGQLLLLFVLVATVSIIGMTVIFVGLFSDENAGIGGIPRDFDEGFWDALWWSFNQVLYLQSFADMYGATGWVLIYAFFLSLMGLGTFGILVSVISATIDNRIAALRRGETSVLENNHVLILGWNNKILSVLKQLACLEPGIKAVVLAPLEINEMQQELRIAGIQHEAITVILRSGLPSNRSELERVAINYASSIIILSTNDDESESIKLMVLLAAKKDWAGKLPTLVSEIAHERNYELAQIASNGRLQLVSSAKVISRVIVQSIRNPGLSDIYHELFSVDSRRNGIYVQHLPECTDVAIEDLAHRITDAIPIGIIWDKKQNGILCHAAALNPEPDYEIAEDEKLILIARGLPVNCAASEVSQLSAPMINKIESQINVPQQILIIGWTEITDDILLELDAHALKGTKITVLVSIASKEAYQHIEQHQKTKFKNLTLDFVEADAAGAEIYTRIDLKSFQTIVLLANGRRGDKGDIDAQTLSILLRISDQRKYDKVHAHVVVELTDESNRELIAGLGADDIVVSPNVISELLSQISRQKVLGPIYHELLSAGGVEISLRPASDYVALAADCCFDDLITAAQQKREVALGLRLVDENCRVLLNPSRDQIWHLGKNDQVIVLAQQLY